MVGRETRREQKRQMRARGRRALVVAFCVFALLAVVEAVGGLLAGSLALLADSGHVAGDALAIAVALAAARLADRPANRRKTFGYLRAEILAAQVNGVYLTVVAAWTIWQAATRLVSPEHVDGLPMALIGVLGLLANGGVIILLRRGGDGVSVRSALLDSLSDALGAAGAIVAGCVIATTGWRWADPIAALMIAALIAAAALRLLREVLDVLLESAPGRLDVEEIERTMLAVSGVAAVHDTHVWTLTSGFVAMSGHAELGSGADEHAVLDALTAMLSDRFGIDHVTIQPETSRHAAACCDADCDTDRQRGVAIAAGKRV